MGLFSREPKVPETISKSKWDRLNARAAEANPVPGTSRRDRQRQHDAELQQKKRHWS